MSLTLTLTLTLIESLLSSHESEKLFFQKEKILDLKYSTGGEIEEMMAHGSRLAVQIVGISYTSFETTEMVFCWLCTIAGLTSIFSNLIVCPLIQSARVPQQWCGNEPSWPKEIEHQWPIMRLCYHNMKVHSSIALRKEKEKKTHRLLNQAGLSTWGHLWHVGSHL